jgi:nitrogen-specific signal transduction histidine kinase/ActR/RegA family two-component response regulator
MKIRCRDGTIKDVEASTAAIQYNGKSATLGIVRDVTERNKMEEELQKAQRLESLGILTGGIAHDFNNILVSIIGSLSLIKVHAKSGDKFFDYLTRAEKAALRAKGLTQQLLTFSKGGAPIKKTASIPELIEETANFSLRGSRVRCEFSMPGNLWPVEIDEGQMSQVINNLIINAQQAMPDGGIIRIGAENVIIEENEGLPLAVGKYVKVSVKDQGTGIPKAYLQKIFDPYFTTKEKGSGLGLATSYSIIKKHGGYLTAESDAGAGATFYIYLPASEKQILVVKGVVEEEIFSGHGRILFMDDQQNVREVAGDMLMSLGYEVEFAGEGHEAIDLYKQAKDSEKPFDAVILDLTVPGGMGGQEAIRRLRKIDPGVKAIVSSGYSGDPIMSEYRGYGFSGVMAKPYEIKKLGEILYNVLTGEEKRSCLKV